MHKLFLLFLITSLGIIGILDVSAGDAIRDSDTNLRDITIGSTGKYNPIMDSFIEPIRSFFITPSSEGGE